MARGRKRIKLARCSDIMVDRLSALPDEILIYNILALLPMKEAARTAILARRWRSIWSPVLDFVSDFDLVEEIARLAKTKGEEVAYGVNQLLPKRKRLQRFPEANRLAHEAASKYVEWANRVIGAYRGGGLCRFRVCFRFDASFSHVVDSWLTFAPGKGTEVLELDFYGDLYSRSNYKFPSIQTHLIPNLRLLKSLTLRRVGITNGSLESLLLRYPSGARISRIDHAPQLLDLSIGGSFRDRNFDLPSHPLFCYISQLQAVHLNIYHWTMVTHWLPHLPDLSGLKHLTLTLRGNSCDNIHGVISMINAAPCLQHLTLDVYSLGSTRMISEDESANLHLQFLRAIEIVQFTGREEQRRLAEYLIKGVVSLHKVILDSRAPLRRKHRPAQRGVGRWRRCVLRPMLPLEANLVLID